MPRSVSERFDMSKSTLSYCFVRVINAINQTALVNLKWPTGEQLERVKTGFRELNPAFQNAIGIIDGTYIKIKAPKNQSRSYTNRKCFTSVTLQAICDSSKKYINCFAGWPSSVPDIRIFKNSEIYQTSVQNQLQYFPNGEYILGDKAYPCLPWCIPPYMRHRTLTQEQIRFNTQHASVRVIVENSFALLFGRFRRLRDLDMNRIDWIPATIIACCIRHNICIGFGNDDDFETEGFECLNQINLENNPDVIPVIPQRMNTTAEGNLKRDFIMNSM